LIAVLALSVVGPRDDAEVYRTLLFILLAEREEYNPAQKRNA
jgi:hypothetical protein